VTAEEALNMFAFASLKPDLPKTVVFAPPVESTGATEARTAARTYALRNEAALDAEFGWKILDEAELQKEEARVMEEIISSRTAVSSLTHTPACSASNSAWAGQITTLQEGKGLIVVVPLLCFTSFVDTVTPLLGRHAPPLRVDHRPIRRQGGGKRARLPVNASNTTLRPP
jgi:hypothetical protein